jgi:outer membrane protein OmpA-like peptidoglycan-associated protein
VSRLLALLVALTIAGSACAQTGETRPIAGSTADIAAKALDVIGKTRDLTAKTADVRGDVLDIVGPVQDLITVTQTAKVVKIELPADVLFDFDKSEIRPDAAVALGAAADVLRKGVSGAVKIDGHTDSKGAAAYNQKLSADRANSVKTWLVKNGKLPATLAYTLTGYGATKPKVPNTRPDGSDDPAGRQTNRRVEITFTTK